MSTRWYIRSAGKQHGPFSSAQVKKLAQDGRITVDTPVRREQDAAWTSARKVKGLFSRDSPSQSEVHATRTSSRDSDGKQNRSSRPVSLPDPTKSARSKCVLGVPLRAWCLIAVPTLALFAICLCCYVIFTGNDPKEQAEDASSSTHVATSEDQGTDFGDQANHEFVKSHAVRASERFLMLLNPQGVFDKKVFKTNDGKKYLVFDDVPGLEGHSFYYQFEPDTGDILCDSDGGRGRLQQHEVQIRTSGGRTEKWVGYRIVPGDQNTEVQEKEREWLRVVASHLGLCPSSSMVLSDGTGSSVSLYAVYSPEGWRFYDMKGEHLPKVALLSPEIAPAISRLPPKSSHASATTPSVDERERTQPVSSLPGFEYSFVDAGEQFRGWEVRSEVKLESPDNNKEYAVETKGGRKIPRGGWTERGAFFMSPSADPNDPPVYLVHKGKRVGHARSD